jgi:hypothetical protein
LNRGLDPTRRCPGCILFIKCTQVYYIHTVSVCVCIPFFLQSSVSYPPARLGRIAPTGLHPAGQGPGPRTAPPLPTKLAPSSPPRTARHPSALPIPRPVLVLRRPWRALWHGSSTAGRHARALPPSPASRGFRIASWVKALPSPSALGDWVTTAPPRCHGKSTP